jgi:hypothetical protein
MEFGDELCKRIRSLGFWADYIDPCSGLPMLTKDCNKVYSEGTSILYITRLKRRVSCWFFV